LASGYRHRVEKFLIEMVQHPITVENSKPHPASYTYCFRPEEKSRFLGNPSFRYKARTDVERLEAVQEHSKWIDTVGNHKLKQWLRPREQEKEVNPRLRFAARDSLERIVDGTQRGFAYKIDTTMSPTRSLNQSCGATPRDFAGSPRQINSFLHAKTHFKAV
jgi:hypothetical protein